MDASKVWRWIERYYIAHILFWIYSFWAALHERVEFHGGSLLSHFPTVALIKTFQIASVYFTLLYLLPRFLNRNKYLVFILCTCANVIVCGFGSALSIAVYARMVKHVQPFSIYFMAVSLIVDILIITTVFIAVTIIYNRFKSDQLNRKVEKERLETELSFLKAQINPHFLFNAINSIYVLIDIDKQQASETLIKFSNMLRYQLYECNDDQIEIEKELAFINDYVGIESLRREENLQITFQQPQKFKYFRLPPFLLMPFVENAFKHVSKSNYSLNFISINAEFADHTFQFKVSNTYEEHSTINGKGGIGLQNVKRRLELLFPNRHNLKIEKSNSIHSAILTLHVS